MMILSRESTLKYCKGDTRLADRIEQAAVVPGREYIYFVSRPKGQNVLRVMKASGQYVTINLSREKGA